MSLDPPSIPASAEEPSPGSVDGHPLPNAAESPFPHDIVEYIINILHNERATLLSCSLVSHSWLSPSRFHLFTDIRIPTRQIGSLLEFARKRTLGYHFTRRVYIDGEWTSDKSTRIAVAPSSIDDIASAFPNVEYLHLASVLLDDEGLAAASASRSLAGILQMSRKPKQTLKTLIFTDCGDSSGGLWGLSACLSVFRTLGELSLRGVHAHNYSIPHQSESSAQLFARSLPVIDTLIIDDNRFYTDLFIRSLCLAQRATSIKSIDLQSLTIWDIGQLGMLLDRIGGTLRSLELQMSSFHDDPEVVDEFCAALNLTSCISLERFTLKSKPGPLQKSPLAWTSIAAILHGLTRSHIAELYLHLHPQFVVDSIGLHGNVLDTVLFEFSKLAKVYFVFEEAISKDSVAFIEESFELIRRSATKIIVQSH